MTRYIATPCILLFLLTTFADAEPAKPVNMRELIEADWIDRDAIFAAAKLRKPEQEKKVAPKPKAASACTTAEDAAGGCDGIKNGRLGFHTASNEKDAWWQVDLGKEVKLDRVVVYNRTDGSAAPRTKNIRVLVSADGKPDQFKQVYQHDGTTFYGIKEKKPLEVKLGDKKVTARIVRLQVPGHCSFALDEVEVYAADDPKKNIALDKPADQKSVGPASRASKAKSTQKAKKVSPVPKTQPSLTGGGFKLDHTDHVIAKASKLAERLQGKADAKRLAPALARLEEIAARLAALKKQGDVPEAKRREIYLQARWVAREIAFSNRLLDIEKLLFIKRHKPGGLFHMVHQYYGFGATPGGGLFVLQDPFSAEPKLVDLLESSVVENGRLAGKELVPGAFLSPEVSYDGKTILFSYTQHKGAMIEWSPRSSYHIFQVNADGTGLVQLTDGSWDDFDPCFLPGGRIVFISARRGGYLRCGGSAPPYDSPNYTLHSMEPDGSDIICLSYHDSQEWHPSVDNNGMIVYTRWDYIDRDTNVAHHIWTCYPDGRNPRSYHGNYPTDRSLRPWMEMSIRAVPGSRKYVSTAAPHHGHAFGSLVLIDHRPEDDHAMSQLEMLTPDTPFPESTYGKLGIPELGVYGTAWPLSEEDYLCVYDPHATNRGVYWIDRQGNRELIYRDPEISCLSPMPLRSRPRPPVIADRTTQTAAAKKAAKQDRPATVAVMNVYDSDFEWPEDTEITALRVIQVLPKTTPPANKPRIGVGSETNARAVLGTVPIEADGSAYFEAPVGKLIYFQALDKRGLAVQSMRSGTYLHPGERLTCQGCHERKRRPPTSPRNMPLAMRRPPSIIEPDLDGSNPFNYVRLVQPVLDRNCVGCHQEKKALDLTGPIEGQHGWTRSYTNLAKKYGFYFHVTNGSIKSGVHGGSRTIAGQFGARASKLLEYMRAEHHGVKLSEEDFHRLTLWLDSNSEFLGSYRNAEAQARGELVLPTLD